MTMPDFWSLLHVPTIELLGWTLLHFVWQGALMAGVLAGALHLLREHAPTVRYGVSCGALVLLLALPLGTGVLLNTGGGTDRPGTTASPVAAVDEADVAALVESGAVPAVESTPASLQMRARDWLRPAIPWIVMGWGLGVLAFSLRLAGGAWRVRRLRRASGPAPDEWTDRVRKLAGRLGLGQVVPVRVSANIDTPLVAGWWRPVVLVPAGLVSGFPPEQVEALLLHELAHVRRHDILIGRLQVVVETLLFFHPATWWISRQVRRTREACCDDLAVQAGTDRRTYAQALAHLAEQTLDVPAASGAVAATDGPLLNRVRRLLAPTEAPKTTARRLSVAIAVGLIVAVPLGLAACASQQSTASGGSEEERPPVAETAPTEPEEGDRADVEEGDDEEPAVVVFDDDSTEAVVTFRGEPEVRVDSVPGGIVVYTGRDAAHDSIVIRRRSRWMPPELFEREWRSRIHAESLAVGPPPPRWRPQLFEGRFAMPSPPDSIEGMVFRTMNPDSLVDSFRVGRWADSFEPPQPFVLRADTFEFPDRPWFAPDSVERALRFERGRMNRRARELRSRADSMRVELRKRLNAKLEADRVRLRELEDRLEHELRAQMEADTVRHMLTRRADSLARWHEEHADSLREAHRLRADSLPIRFREMERRTEREMPERLRQQARRLREQAEQLEERAREMEEMESETVEPSDTTGTSESGASLRYRDAGRFWIGPFNDGRRTTRFNFDPAATGWFAPSLRGEYTL